MSPHNNNPSRNQAILKKAVLRDGIFLVKTDVKRSGSIHFQIFMT